MLLLSLLTGLNKLNTPKSFTRQFMAVLVAVSFVQSPMTIALAKIDDTGKKDEAPAGRIDPAEVRDLLNAAMDESLKIADRVDAIRYAAKFPYQDVVDGLLATLLTEVDNKGRHEIRLNLVENLFFAIGEVATRNATDDLTEIIELLWNSYPVTAAEGQLSRSQVQDRLQPIIKDAGEKVMAREESLPSLPVISSRALVKVTSLGDRLNDFRKCLQTYVKGQPRVVEALVKQRSRDLFYGFRDEPSFHWFLGPPGTGKDTAVNAYVKCANDELNAVKNHVFRVDPLRQEGDLWALLGSATGYVGSDSLPGIIKFLVDHSGGKYSIEEIKERGGDTKYKVVENPAWKEGMVLPGYASPDRAIVYLDEFHDWRSDLKNAVVKKAIEYEGVWKINNPNGGLTEIRVPINIVAASNDALEKVTSREKNGQRFGRPLTYQEMLEKTEAIANNPQALRDSILAGNGDVNSSGKAGVGTSEELLNRVSDENLILFYPLPPETLQEIANFKLKSLAQKIQRSRSGFSNLNLTWTPEVTKFLQEYHYIAEENARRVDDRIRSMIESTIIQAASQDKLVPHAKFNLKLDVRQKADNTWELVFELNGLETSESVKSLFNVDIDATSGDKARTPISDEKIDELLQLPNRLKKGVVGQDNALEKIARAVFISEEGRQGIKSAADAKEPARTFMLLGPTSTGKTETAKILAEALFNDRNAAVTIDFSQVQNVMDLKQKILGLRDGSGNGIPSDFMKHYDRNNGRVVFVFDEIANVRDKEILNALYDILREPVVSTFSDGRERIMSNVTIMITGNASQELLAQLPQDLPEDVMRAAWTDIYEQLNTDPFMRRDVLEKYFSVPFIARIGDERIFFYQPLGYAAVRELVQLKFGKVIQSLAAKEGRRGWEVRVPSKEEYVKLMEALERQGFVLKEQGASIDRFVGKEMQDAVRETLLREKVSSGEQVTIRVARIEQPEMGSRTAKGVNRTTLVLELGLKDGKKLEVSLAGKPVIHEPDNLVSDQILTAFHESGHTTVGAALLGDFEYPTHLRIIPGVTKIGDDWIYYAGVAGSKSMVETKTTKDWVIRQIAILFGGTVAESLVVKGGMNSAGRQNDMMRATALAERAILEFGMSEKWGFAVKAKSELSDREKQLLKEEVDILLRDGEELARMAILANKAFFVELGNELARKGELHEKDIQVIHKNHPIINDGSTKFVGLAENNKHVFNSAKVQSRPGLKYEFIDTIHIVKESEVADIRKMIETRRQNEMKKVAIPNEAPILGTPGGESSKKKCEEIFSP